MLLRQSFKVRDQLPNKISDLQVSEKMAARETEFCLQLCEICEVVIDVKISDGSHAFVGPLYKSSIHCAWYKTRVLTNRGVGRQSGEIQHTLYLLQNLQCVTHNKIILKTSKREI